MEPLASYPVFQADQVLTNGHLNNLFNYLEQQGRLSRMKLIGNGIVCGLAVTSEANRIFISKGVGLTTQGYLVNHCDTAYTHYVPYTFPDLPDDLHLLATCGEGERTALPLYGNRGILELTDGESALRGKKTLQGFDRSSYVIVLFLEAVQTDLKNCDTNDCNDKGSRMDFTVKPLLVPKKLFPQPKQTGFNSVLLKRYNVPAQELGTAEAVLGAFRQITDDDTLQKLSFNLANCWDRHAAMLGLRGANPLKSLDLVKLREQFSAANNNLHHIQYFYDFVDDLLKAFIEFRGAVRDVREVCCADEWASPLHISLGEAGKHTAVGGADPFRHDFQPTPILAEGKQEAYVLLQRICQMVGSFKLDLLAKRRVIAITPTNLGTDKLAYRCVPYYYAHDELLPYWNYSRFLSGNFRFNMGYHATAEAGFSDAVASPLLYDIERYDAFRIEGHIGMQHDEALKEILRQRQAYNLPIDVLALNVADLNDVMQGREIRCIVQDLESDYAVLIAGMLCKIKDIISYVATLRPRNPQLPDIRDPKDLLAEKGKKTGTLSRNVLFLQAEKAQQVVYTDKKVIVESQGKKAVAIPKESGLDNLDKLFDLKGTPAGDLGPSLFEIVNNGFKDKIIDPSRLDLDLFKPYLPRPEYLVNFLNDLDAILKYLIDASLADFDADSYLALWNKYADNVKLITKELANTGEDNAAMKAYFAATNYGTVLFRCTNEELLALKMEYDKRLIRYETAINFSRYYEKNTGLEHKAGVPKGGTFVLVYQSRPTTNQPPRKGILDLLGVQDVKAGASRAELELVRTPATDKALASKDTGNAIDKTRESLLLTKGSAAVEEVRAVRDILKKMGLADDSYAAFEKALREREKELTAQQSAIPYDVVIADFYLPYQCNSACAPIAYVFQESPPPVPDEPVEPEEPVEPDEPVEPEKEPSISVDETQFCETDRSTFKVRIEPAGGKLTIGGKEASKPVFVPAELGVGTHKLEYALGDRVASTSVTVTAAPQAAFGLAKASFKGEAWSVTFVPNTPNKGAKYSWMLQGKEVSATEKAALEFDLPTYLGKDYLTEPTGRLITTRRLTQTRNSVALELALAVSNPPCPDSRSAMKITLAASVHPIARGQGKQEVPFEVDGRQVKFVAMPKGVEFTGKSLVVDPEVLFAGVTARTITAADRVVACYVSNADETVFLILVLRPAEG